MPSGPVQQSSKALDGAVQPRQMYILSAPALYMLPTSSGPTCSWQGSGFGLDYGWLPCVGTSICSWSRNAPCIGGAVVCQRNAMNLLPVDNDNTIPGPSAVSRRTAAYSAGLIPARISPQQHHNIDQATSSIYSPVLSREPVSVTA